MEAFFKQVKQKSHPNIRLSLHDNRTFIAEVGESWTEVIHLKGPSPDGRRTDVDRVEEIHFNPTGDLHSNLVEIAERLGVHPREIFAWLDKASSKLRDQYVARLAERTKKELGWTYHHLRLPLLKAVEAFEGKEAETERNEKIDCFLALPLPVQEKLMVSLVGKEPMGKFTPQRFAEEYVDYLPSEEEVAPLLKEHKVEEGYKTLPPDQREDVDAFLALPPAEQREVMEGLVGSILADRLTPRAFAVKYADELWRELEKV